MQAVVLAIAQRTPSARSAAEQKLDYVLVTDRTPFYAESGGQVGDTGTWSAPSGRGLITACSKQDGYCCTSYGVGHGHLELGDEIRLEVNAHARRAIERNHTATHLLHQALKDVLGGSRGPGGLAGCRGAPRFDFTTESV
jgi:alanyl-tRNA synthetase